MALGTAIFLIFVIVCWRQLATITLILMPFVIGIAILCGVVLGLFYMNEEASKEKREREERIEAQVQRNAEIRAWNEKIARVASVLPYFSLGKTWNQLP